MNLLYFSSSNAFNCLLLITDVLTVLTTWNCHLRLRGTASSGFSQLILRKHLLKSINAVFCFPQLLEFPPCASLCFEVGWEQSAWALSRWSMVVSPLSSRSGSAGQGFHRADMHWSCIMQGFQKLLWKTYILGHPYNVFINSFQLHAPLRTAPWQPLLTPIPHLSAGGWLDIPPSEWNNVNRWAELIFLTLAFSIAPSLAGVPGLLPTSLWFRELDISKLKTRNIWLFSEMAKVWWGEIFLRSG